MFIPFTVITVAIWGLPHVGVWGQHDNGLDEPPGIEYLLIGIAFAAVLTLVLTSGQGIVLGDDALALVDWGFMPRYGLSIPYSSIRRVEVDRVARAVNVVYEGEFVEGEWSDEFRPTRLNEFVNELQKRVKAVTETDLEIVDQPSSGLGFRETSG